MREIGRFKRFDEATTNIYKLLSTLLKVFTFELAHEREREGVETCLKAESRSFSVLVLVTCRGLCSLELKFVGSFKEELQQRIISLL